MSGLNLNVEGALTTVRTMLGEATHQRQRHWAAPPAFPVAAAGQGFSTWGAQVAMMLEELHRGVDTRLDVVEATADAAAREVGVFRDADAGISHRLGQVDGEGR